MITRSLRALVVLNEPSNPARNVYSIQVMNGGMSETSGDIAYRFTTRPATEADSRKAIEESLKTLEADLLIQGFKLTKTESQLSEGPPRTFWEVSGHGIKAQLNVQIFPEAQGPYLKVTYNINKA